MSNESLADTIIPKSEQLNADDLIAGPITVTVEGVKRSSSPDQPIDILISGHRPFRPCKSMRRVLISVWGDKGSEWIGQSMTLYRDETVKYGGVAVGGIRISHVTGIDKRRDLMLTSTRSKREMYTVNPLPGYPQADFDANLDGWVKAIQQGKIDIPGLLSRVSKKGLISATQLNTLENAVKSIAADKE